MENNIVNIFISTFRKIGCIVLENKMLQVAILPAQGGKICSIIDKKSKKELLWQNSEKEYIFSNYDDAFTDGDMSGFDEMFPSISQCFYLKKPWENIRIPDHGEVWPLAWEYKIYKNHVLLETNGVRFPYRIEKRVMLIDNYIYIKYSLKNMSPFDFDFIWAAHPLFNASENMQIILPSDVKKIMNAYENSKKLGAFGEIHDWPVVEGKNNEKYDISKVPSASAKECEKFFVYGPMKKGWAVLYDKKDNYAIELKFPIHKVPYLGIWIDAYGYSLKPQYNVALEPSTGAYDSLNTAQQESRCTTVKAKSKYSWWLQIGVGKVKKLDRIKERVIF